MSENKDKEPEKYSRSYIDNSWGQLFQQENTRDRYLLSMAAGAGVLSVTLLGVIKDPYVYLWSLLLAWVGFLGGLLFIFASLQINIKALSKAVDLEGKEISEVENFKIDRLNKIGKGHNIIGFSFVLFALIMLGVFAGTNIQGDKNDETEKDECRCKSTATKTYCHNDERSAQRCNKESERKRSQSENTKYKQR